jgi:hypothetical protein
MPKAKNNKPEENEKVNVNIPLRLINMGSILETIAVCTELRLERINTLNNLKSTDKNFETVKSILCASIAEFEASLRKALDDLRVCVFK